MLPFYRGAGYVFENLIEKEMLRQFINAEIPKNRNRRVCMCALAPPPFLDSF